MKIRLSTAAVSLAVLAIPIGFVLLMFSTAGPFRSVGGRGVTAAEANARLWHCCLPPSATDVWFESSYRATRVEFAVDEATFFDWCRGHDWQPIPISTRDPKAVYSERTQDAVVIPAGAWFHARTQENSDFGYAGIYDAN